MSSHTSDAESIRPPRTLRIPRSMVEDIVTHLRSAIPNEGCGLIGVDFDLNSVIAREFFPGVNVDHSPTRFTMEPSEVIAAFKAMRETGVELGAIVHSHPTSAAEPSPTDLRESYYPDALSVIVSFRGQQPDFRTWEWLPEGASRPFRECDIDVFESLD